MRLRELWWAIVESVRHPGVCSDLPDALYFDAWVSEEVVEEQKAWLKELRPLAEHYDLRSARDPREYRRIWEELRDADGR